MLLMQLICACAFHGILVLRVTCSEDRRANMYKGSNSEFAAGLILAEMLDGGPFGLFDVTVTSDI